MSTDIPGDEVGLVLDLLGFVWCLRAVWDLQTGY